MTQKCEGYYNIILTMWEKQDLEQLEAFCKSEMVQIKRDVSHAKLIVEFDQLVKCTESTTRPIRTIKKKELRDKAIELSIKQLNETDKLTANDTTKIARTVLGITEPIDVEPIIPQKPQITTHTYTKTETVKRFTEDKWLAERIISLYCIATRDDGTTYSGPINLTYEDKLPIKTKIEKGILLENKKILSTQ